MRLQELLNKFTNTEFLITVNGWCNELSFVIMKMRKSKNIGKNIKIKK